jgi:UDP-N-acetylmuramoyl-L-alanyl-D-glutamate--2,6-diaminopimelate ligase
MASRFALRLSELVGEAMAETRAGSDIEIAGLTCDSRAVEPGYLFAALPGMATDGSHFINDAARRGASALLAPPGSARLARDANLPLIEDDNPRRRYALMAARFFERQPRTIAAVTGTNGKTSVVSFARQIWGALGHAAASVGTLGVSAPGFTEKAGLTTPDSADLHRTLRDLADAGIDHLAIEASSHGLAQSRSDGVRLTAAAFTNLTRDHLDYHGDEERYFAAKARLFDELLPSDGTAVLNADSPTFDRLAGIARARGQKILSYGVAAVEDPSHLALRSLDPIPDGQRLTIVIDGHEHVVDVALVGDFQAANVLCALGLVIACGADVQASIAALATVHGVPGRLERVARRESGAAVFVDYAHTPDALSAALSALRPSVQGRLHLVFGCGGDRDQGKRPRMGAIAEASADKVIVTDDNPRGEDAATIRAAIMQQCPSAREIGDRGEAIAAAVEGLDPGDILLIAGKGHESGQIIGARTVPFDDRELARDVVARLDAGGRS